jgi:hypothetical protein
LEWAEWQKSLCTGCGRPRHESFDVDGEPYIAEAWCCFACQAVEHKAREWSGSEAADPAGIKFVVREGGGES